MKISDMMWFAAAFMMLASLAVKRCDFGAGRAAESECTARVIPRGGNGTITTCPPDMFVESWDAEAIVCACPGARR